MSFSSSETPTVEIQEQKESSSFQETSDQKSLYVYVYNSQYSTKIFSVNSSTTDGVTSSRIAASHILSTAFDNKMYNFDYSSTSISDWTFSACTSVDRWYEKNLTSPKAQLNRYSSRRFDFCGLEGNHLLYLYDKGFYTSSGLSQFADSDQPVGNVFSYSCERDTWSIIRNMKTPVDESSMTACIDTLYFIGGKNPRGLTTERYVQAFDYRGVWLHVPSTNSFYESAVSCAFNEKLYVCSASGSNCETYDVRAGKWSMIEPVNIDFKSISVQKLIPFSNKLWLFAKRVNKYTSAPKGNFRVYLYDPISNTWTKNSMLNRLVESTLWSGGHVIDAVVFNSL